MSDIALHLGKSELRVADGHKVAVVQAGRPVAAVSSNLIDFPESLQPAIVVARG